jgi:hypothetical protein
MLGIASLGPATREVLRTFPIANCFGVTAAACGSIT